MILWLHGFGIYSRLYFLGGMTVLMSIVLGSVYLFGEFMNERSLQKEAALVGMVGKLHDISSAFRIMSYHERQYFHDPEPERLQAFASSGNKLQHMLLQLYGGRKFEAGREKLQKLSGAISEYQEIFGKSTKLLEKLGHDDDRGLKGQFRDAAFEAQARIKLINRPDILIKLLQMRQYDSAYRLSKNNNDLNRFKSLKADIFKTFTENAAQDTELRQIRELLEIYTGKFMSWVEMDRKLGGIKNRIYKSRNGISDNLAAIEDLSARNLRKASQLHYKTRKESYVVILSTIILATFVLLFLSSAIASSLSRPLKYLSRVMKGLANGEVHYDVPYYTLDNEFGEMARAVKVFKAGIIARSQIEAKLRETAERYNLAIKGSNSGIWDWDVAGRKSHYSESFMEVLGLPVERHETSDMFLLERVHPQHRELYLEAMKNDLLKNEHRIDLEIMVRHKNGSYLWLQIIGWAVEECGGRVKRAVGKIIDISSLKETELELRRHQINLEKTVASRTRELRESQSTLEEAINAIPEGFILTDTEGRVILANELIKQYYPDVAGIMKKGTPIRDMIRGSFPNESEAQIEARLRDFLEAKSGEIRITSDGTWLQVVRKKIPGLGVIGLYNDITEFRLQEDELIEQAARLELALSSERELVKLQRSFVSMASHELRTPLAIIDGVAHRMSRLAGRGRLEPEDVVKRVEQIQSSVKRMVNLMESTLSAARMDAGKVTIKPDDCNLRDVINEVCERQRLISPSHNISISLDDLPQIIHGDSPALEQVFTNLLSNAVKYSPDAPDITIMGWREGENVLVSITDNGLGIDEDDLPGMFGRFFRAKTSTGIAGTGIGLSLVKMFVEEHGGQVRVKSVKGQGSTFTLSLPIAGPATGDNDESGNEADVAA